MNAYYKPRLLHLVYFNLTAEIAAVCKRKSVTVSMLFTCRPITENDKRIVLMAGHAALALYRLYPMI